jgi:ABC-type nitrate/sulfonate/bicarbonate transport system substrate-binding protein
VVQEIGIGSERFGYADATTMANLVSKGLPVKMIANYVQTSPMSIIFFADAGIKSPKDLEGKKVSFTAGDSLHQNFPALIKLNRVDKSKVQEVLLAPAAKQTAVMTGTVDAMGGYYTTQAGLIESETKKKVAYIRYTDFGVGAMTQGLFVHTKNLGEKSLNCRMVRATGRAWQAAMKDPDGAVAALHKLFPKTNKGLVDLTKKQWLDSPTSSTRNPHRARLRPHDEGGLGYPAEPGQGIRGARAGEDARGLLHERILRLQVKGIPWPSSRSASSPSRGGVTTRRPSRRSSAPRTSGSTRCGWRSTTPW